MFFLYIIVFIVFHINLVEASQITVSCRQVLIVNNYLFGCGTE